MLLRLYFTEFLLAFCAVHLVYAAKEYVSGKIAAYRQKHMPATAAADKMVLRGAEASDWYVYFRRSDLVGEDCLQKTPRSPDKRDGATRPRAVAPKRPRDGRATAHPNIRLACS